MLKKCLIQSGNVHCRTGSLERHQPEAGSLRGVHCRTGSLEKVGALSVARGKQVSIANYKRPEKKPKP